jgi:Na+/proline symporter
MNGYAVGIGIGMGLVGAFYWFAAAVRESQGAFTHAVSDTLVGAAFFGVATILFVAASLMRGNHE